MRSTEDWLLEFRFKLNEALNARYSDEVENVKTEVKKEVKETKIIDYSLWPVDPANLEK